ncbi:MAG: protease inhibitor I42 family protein [Actinomycetes bacterium]
MAVIGLDHRHNGQRVAAKVGDTVELVLPEKATTGFQWEADDPGDALAVESSELVPPADARAGAAATRRVVVRAVQPGNGRLSLRLRRPWEPVENADDDYAVDIDVT